MWSNSTLACLEQALVPAVERTSAEGEAALPFRGQ